MASDEKVWRVSRATKEPKFPEKEPKKLTPSAQRELALADIAERLGESKGWNQKANNAFVYYQLPTFTSFGMAFEKRMSDLVNLINGRIIECTCKDQPCENHPGRSIIIEGGIFENTNTLTEWFMNFFQQSPSINGLARENQVEIAKAGYSQVAMVGYQTTPTKIDLNV